MNAVSYKLFDKSEQPINFKLLCNLAGLKMEQISKIGFNAAKDGEIVYSVIDDCLANGEKVWQKVSIK